MRLTRLILPIAAAVTACGGSTEPRNVGLVGIWEAQIPATSGHRASVVQLVGAGGSGTAAVIVGGIDSTVYVSVSIVSAPDGPASITFSKGTSFVTHAAAPILTVTGTRSQSTLNGTINGGVFVSEPITLREVQ
ncbi:MAG TPA: hypothetical protein VGM50_23080 [Gemmatimonadaceae bacterium]|jgi:hypothetical protein